MQIPTMMATTITEENYDLVASFFPAGFLGYKKSEVLGQKVVINEPNFQYISGPVTRYEAAGADMDDSVRRPVSLVRTSPPTIIFQNVWMSKKKFKRAYKHAGPADELGFRPVIHRDN